MLHRYTRSTDDVDRLRFVVVANILHSNHCSQQVHAQAQLVKVLLSEQPDARRQQVLEKKRAE